MAKSLGTQKYEQRLILPLGYVNFLFSLIILVISAADILVSTRFTVLRRLFCVVLLLAVLPPPQDLALRAFSLFLNVRINNSFPPGEKSLKLHLDVNF